MSSTLAAFIGIDTYAAPSIRDLSGAKRDATALWALFTDSIPAIQSTLLVNDQATASNVRDVLANTLGAAGTDDTVIISFAGHGSRSHRLIAYDTSVADFTRSTIGMGDLADAFRESNAKFILCLLDCCFSGGATARVFEDSLISRDADLSFEAVVEGKGRMLFAASNTNEPAYEHPTTRHGLFTGALIEAFATAGDRVDLASLATAVMERVRADAGRMGVVQTPVAFGQIEGGMVLPALRPGVLFRAAFPEASGMQVGKPIRELSGFGIPEPVIDAWVERYPDGLNDLQLAAVNDCCILDGQSLLVVAPTSAGKTFIGELAAVRAVTEGRKAVFLLPYRALVNEKYDQFSALYGDVLGLRVVRCTGDYADAVDEFVRGRYDLALLTYEMFLNLAVSNGATLNQIGLVVLDEAQFITDPNRGISVELLLTLIIAARERGIQPQLVALSAVIGDINHFDEWLGIDRLMTDERPVKLVEGVIDRTGIFQYVDDDGASQTMQMIPQHSVHVRRNKPSAQDVIVPLVTKLIADGEKVIVFRNQRGKAAGCARYLAAELVLPPATGVVAQLPPTDLSSASSDLRTCLRGGTAFHSTHLNRDERSVVEAAFRDPRGLVRVLGATTTVAAGINTPASTVILAEQEFTGKDGRPFTIAEYKNMAGRAGRLGFAGKDGVQEHGKAIIYAETGFQRQQLFTKYVTGQVEPVRSSFDVNSSETWVLRLLAQVPRVPRDQLVSLLANTYGGYLANRAHPDWQAGMRRRLEAVMQEMLAFDLLEANGNDIQLTLLGRACGRSSLGYRSAIRLIDLLKNLNPQALTAERLMALVQALPEADGGYTPLMKRGRAETIRPQEAAHRFGPDVVRLLQRQVDNEWDYYARCKRACILGAWVDGEPMGVIEKRYSPNFIQGVIGPGDVRRFADATRFHLRPAHEIANIIHITHGINDGAIDAILRRLEVGVPEGALALLSLPESLPRGAYIDLAANNILTPDILWRTDVVLITQILGEQFMKRILRHKPKELLAEAPIAVENEQCYAI